MRKRTEQRGDLKPEQKIAIAIEMSDICMQICAAGIRVQNPNLSEKHLLKELEKRIEWRKRSHSGKRRFIV